MLHVERVWAITQLCGCPLVLLPAPFLSPALDALDTLGVLFELRINVIYSYNSRRLMNFKELPQSAKGAGEERSGEYREGVELGVAV